MERLLIDDQPLLVLPRLAAIIGLNEAIVLQQIHYWIVKNEEKKRNFYDGFYWTYNTMEEWAKQFPFWSKKTAERTFGKLKEKNIIVLGNFNKKSYDRTNWYRIDYEQLETLGISHKDKVSQSTETKFLNGNGQSVPLETDTLTQTIPETNTETNKDNTRQNKYDEDSTYFKMATYFHERVSKVANDAGISHLIKKSNMQTWADDMRKLVELDQVDKRLAKDVMDWVTQDSFWRTNVLSAKKLREKFTDLAIKMNAEKKPVQPKVKQEFDYRDREIQFQQWIAAGNEAEDFNWETGEGNKV